jgi:hypothetical protein
MFPPELNTQMSSNNHSTDLTVRTDGDSSIANSSIKRKRGFQGKKEIVYQNTNFEENSLRSLTAKNLRGRHSVPGTPSILSDTSSWETDSVFHQSEDGWMDSKRAKSYGTVQMTPVIVPGVDMSPLITWGEVAIDPVPLSPAPLQAHQDLGNENGFTINKLTDRESAARKLQLQATKKRGVSTPMNAGAIPSTPLSVASKVTDKSRRSTASSASTASRRSTLTPAGIALAQRLAQNKSRSSLDIENIPFGGGLTSFSTGK